ncbi:MAG: CvpA family protein [Candidatus Levybacteria bacterium]|nr:CvpA family protein [Candidatus Levybacteria bacterium]
MISFTDFNQIVQIFSIKALGLNWVDLLIILILLIYAVEGYALGFLRATFDFLGFVFSFILALYFYDYLGNFFSSNFSIPRGFSNAIGFFTTAFISEVALSFIFRQIYKKSTFLSALSSKLSGLKNINGVLGVIPGIASAIVLLAFVLTMIIVLPLSTFLKNSVTEARLGKILISNTQGLEGDLNQIFGGAVKDALTFLTVDPVSEEVLKLNFKTKNLSVDEKSEREMFEKVNQEREKKGLSELIYDQSLTNVGRKHCKDMFVRGYFSHYTPEGFSPFDRMATGDIIYTYAGENLALAPNTSLAMQGLMRSEGHRQNILSEDFGSLGVGVIDGGVYGQMYCQEFTD